MSRRCRKTGPIVGAGDTFDRADTSSGLGTASDGVPWTAATGVFGISSNQAYLASWTGGSLPLSSGCAVSTRPMAGAIQDVTITMVRPAGGYGNAGLVFGYVDNNNTYVMEFNSTTGAQQLYKIVAGTATSLGSAGGHAGTTVCRVVFNRNTGLIQFYQQGSLILTVTDLSLSGSTIGLFGGQTFFNNGGMYEDLVAPDSSVAYIAPFIDNFNRANASTLGASYSDQLNFSVKSSQAMIDNTVVVGTGYGVRDFGYADVTVSAKIVSDLTTSGATAGLMLRFQDGSNFLYFDGRSGGGQLYKVVAGSSTVLITSSSAFANGDTVSVKMIGSALTLYKNGTQVGTATDAALSTKTKHGLRGVANGFAACIMDDLVITAA